MYIYIIPPYPSISVVANIHAARRPKKWHRLLPESGPSKAQQPAQSPHGDMLCSSENNETMVVKNINHQMVLCIYHFMYFFLHMCVIYIYICLCACVCVKQWWSTYGSMTISGT